MPITALRHQVLDYAKRMAHDGLANGSQGNVSAIDRGRGLIAITPSAADYATMRARDIVVIDLDGAIVKGRWKPTIEMPLHLGFYQRRPEVGAVIHCHAPQVSGFAAALRPIPLVLAEAACCVGGEVPVAPFAPSGTPEFAAALLDVVGERNACVMGQHGLVTCGVNLKRAYATAVAVEDNARAYLLARQLGVEPTPLPDALCAELHAWWLSSYRQVAVG